MAYDPEQLFTAEQTARAAGTTSGALRAWLQRGAILPGDGDKPANGSGYYNFFTLNRVVQVALTVELVMFGLPTRIAGTLAASFTDLAEPSYMPDTGGETRLPGALYATGRTVLIAHEGQHDVARVVRVTSDTPAMLLFSIPGGPRATVACMVDVNAVVSRVRAALGVAE